MGSNGIDHRDGLLAGWMLTLNWLPGNGFGIPPSTSAEWT